MATIPVPVLMSLDAGVIKEVIDRLINKEMSALEIVERNSNSVSFQCRTSAKVTNQLVDDLTGRRRLDMDSFVALFQSKQESESFICETIRLISGLINDPINETVSTQDSGTSVTDDKIRIVDECIKNRREEVRNGLENLMTCHSIDPLFLSDFDWRLTYVFTCNKMADMNEPLVELDMKLTHGPVQSIEMNAKEVSLLLNHLRSAREEIQ